MAGASDAFRRRAERMLALPVATQVSSLGGYGPDGEVIYLGHPGGAPATLIDSRQNVKAIFASNGSVSFTVTRPEGMEIPVLSGSFDGFEKRETGVLSSNVWLALGEGRRGGGQRIASLLNPSLEMNLPALSRKIIKRERPIREIFYCSRFAPDAGVAIGSVIRMALVLTPAGPAILRQVYLKNLGSRNLSGSLWTLFNLHGTQQRVYDKELWYDIGMPLSLRETVCSCTVPYSDIVQVKRVSSLAAAGLRPASATCSYLSFVGDSGQFSLLPEALRRGALLEQGAGGDLNRFSVPTIAANQFALALPAGRSTCLHQALLYVANEATAQRFRLDASSEEPGFVATRRHFKAAAGLLVRHTPGVKALLEAKEQASDSNVANFFHLQLPRQHAIAEYVNSIWAGTSDLYGRNYGGRIADGVELPFRDRCQDMWPMMIMDPARVRADLVHAFGFMYHTTDKPISTRKRLTLLEKLHGSYPRQYPSLWLDREKVIHNDNRPFADGAIWPIETLLRYVRQTGDESILCEEVTTVEFADPSDPERGGIRGGKKRQRTIEAVVEILKRYERLCADSPYGMVQILYGDWCDPVDLFGTDRIGEGPRRGLGRGVSTRLSAQVFLTTLETIDLLETPVIAKAVSRHVRPPETCEWLKRFADRLRKSIMRYAWEDAAGKAGAGFIDSIHELARDGRRPRLDKGEIGYTLGSMRPEREFDRRPRRVLTSMAYGLKMLLAERAYLSPVPLREEKAAALLRTVDELAYEKDVGLKLYTTALANSQTTLRYVGRMGLLPSGCAENGEYHHAQAFMHRFRVEMPGQTDRAWSQFREMLSVTRDERLLGPFDSLANSFASDRDDPYFGAGMIFGFSGTADWIIETIEQIAGLELDLLGGSHPAVRVNPRLPREFDGTLSFTRMIHRHVGKGRYRQIPLHLTIHKARKGTKPGIRINGQPCDAAEIMDISKMREIEIEIRL